MSEALEPVLLPEYARVYRSMTGGCVDVHPTHGKQELKQNLLIALSLADRGEHVCLLPVSTAEGAKNPDATRNGLLWEFKTPEGHTSNAVDKALRDGSKQADCILLQLPMDFDLVALKRGLRGRVRRVETIREVALLLHDKLQHFTRQQVLSEEFREQLNT